MLFEIKVYAQLLVSVYMLNSTRLLITLMLSFPLVAQAGQMYVFKDKSGQFLLTNKVDGKKKPSESKFQHFDQKVQVTYYPDTNVHEYKDWGASKAAVLPSYAKNKDAFDHLIQAAATRHGVDAGLMKAIMHTESSFNPNARSPVGAQGLMQLMPATAQRFGVTNAWDPAQNIEGSAKYLKYLTKRFSGKKENILAGYNAGEGNVDKYGGIPPFKETQNYVVKVLGRYDQLYSQLGSGSVGSSAYSANTYKVISPSSTSNNRLIVSSSGRNSGVRASTISSSGGNSSAYTKSAFNSLR